MKKSAKAKAVTAIAMATGTMFVLVGCSGGSKKSLARYDHAPMKWSFNKVAKGRATASDEGQYLEVKSKVKLFNMKELASDSTNLLKGVAGQTVYVGVPKESLEKGGVICHKGDEPGSAVEDFVVFEVAQGQEVTCRLTGSETYEMDVFYRVMKDSVGFDNKAEHDANQALFDRLSKSEFDVETLVEIEKSGAVNQKVYTVKGNAVKPVTIEVKASDDVVFFKPTSTIETSYVKVEGKKKKTEKLVVDPAGTDLVKIAKPKFKGIPSLALVCTVNSEIVYQGAAIGHFTGKAGMMSCEVNKGAGAKYKGELQFSVATIQKESALGFYKRLLDGDVATKAKKQVASDNAQMEALKGMVGDVRNANKEQEKSYDFAVKEREMKAKFAAEFEKQKAEAAEELERQKNAAVMALEAAVARGNKEKEEALAAAKGKTVEELQREAEAAAAAKLEKEKHDAYIKYAEEEGDKYFNRFVTKRFFRKYYSFTLEPQKFAVAGRDYVDYKLSNGQWVWFTKDEPGVLIQQENYFHPWDHVASKDRWDQARRFEPIPHAVCREDVPTAQKKVERMNGQSSYVDGEQVQREFKSYANADGAKSCGESSNGDVKWIKFLRSGPYKFCMHPEKYTARVRVGRDEEDRLRVKWVADHIEFRYSYPGSEYVSVDAKVMKVTASSTIREEVLKDDNSKEGFFDKLLGKKKIEYGQNRNQHPFFKTEVKAKNADVDKVDESKVVCVESEIPVPNFTDDGKGGFAVSSVTSSDE